MAWNLTDTESQLVFHFFSLTCVGSLIFNLFYLWTTVDCFSVQCLVSSQIQKCVDCWNLHLNPLRIQTVVCCWNFLLFIILSFLIQEYLRFSWSCLSLQRSYLWTGKLFSDHQKGREGWSQYLREPKIGPGTVTGLAMWSAGRTSLTSDDVAIFGDRRCRHFHKVSKCNIEGTAVAPTRPQPTWQFTISPLYWLGL